MTRAAGAGAPSRKVLQHMVLRPEVAAKWAHCRDFGDLTAGCSETNCKPFIHLALR